MKNTKKKNKQGDKLPATVGHVGGKQPTTVHQDESVDNVMKPKNIGHKPKFPYNLCKGENLLIHFPSILKVLDVRSQDSQQPMSPSITGHARDSSSTNDNQDGDRKGKVKFPCKLCGEMHINYHCP
jgi:hypothetical protein